MAASQHPTAPQPGMNQTGHAEREQIEAQLPALAKTTPKAADPSLLGELPLARNARDVRSRGLWDARDGRCASSDGRRARLGTGPDVRFRPGSAPGESGVPRPQRRPLAVG